MAAMRRSKTFIQQYNDIREEMDEIGIEMD